MNTTATKIPEEAHQQICEAVAYGYEFPRVHIYDEHRWSVIDVRACGTYEMPDGSVWAWCITEGPSADVHQWERDGEPMSVTPEDRGPRVVTPRVSTDDPWKWADAVLQTRTPGPDVKVLHDAAYDSYFAPGGRGARIPTDHPLMLEDLRDVSDRWRPMYTPTTAGEVWAREVLTPALGRLRDAEAALANLPPRPAFTPNRDPSPSEMYDAVFALVRHTTHGDTERRGVQVARDAVKRAADMYLTLTCNDTAGLRAVMEPTP